MKFQNSRAGKVAAALLMICAMAAQGQTSVAVAHPSNGVAESLLIGRGDLVHVTVFLMPEMETKARVTDAGDVTLPLVGKVHIAGLTPAEAAHAAAMQYTAGHYLIDPQVTVLVEEYATQSVAIMGEVLRPGTFPVTTPRGVMDTLALAGGFTPSADRHITIQHNGGQKQEVFLPNNARDALAAEALVYPGDLVLVPKAGVVYVLGDVTHPGGYVMQDDSMLTVLQAVAMASGTNRTAKEGSAIVVRRTATGYTEIPVSIKDMQKGKAADMALEREDVLWVPFSYGKNVVITGTSILAGAGSAVIYHY